MTPEKGISRYWTEGQERELHQLLANCKSFAETHMVRAILTMFKYDLRTREGKAAIAKNKLQLAIATDADLRELADLIEEYGQGVEGLPTYDDLVKTRADLREQGITKEDLCSD